MKTKIGLSAVIALLALFDVSCRDFESVWNRGGDSTGKTANSSDTADPTNETTPIVRTVRIERASGTSDGDRDVSTRYELRHRDPVLEEIRKRDETVTEDLSTKTKEIRARQQKEKETKRKEEQVLKSELPPELRPVSLDQFESIVPHRPPVPQYYTGTCWSFSGTSLMESETQRLTGREIKLSEMATVYVEYLAKASRYVDERGDSHFAEGSETNAVFRALSEYGAIPRSVYSGVTAEDQRHDHLRLSREMKGLLKHVTTTNFWDKSSVLKMLRVILDRVLGPLPKEFVYEGKPYNPKDFMAQVLKIELDQYVDFMSTLSLPFYTVGEFKVPDNWWHEKTYHNVPLDEFYQAFKGAIMNGFSASIAFDVSEPGKDSVNDVMFIPEYDIPADHIDQLSREYRLNNGTTTDDHGVHVVGHTRHAERDWFLAKDSGRSARRGEHKGYFFIRGDYIRLKMMAFTVHRDAASDLLVKFE